MSLAIFNDFGCGTISRGAVVDLVRAPFRRGTSPVIGLSIKKRIRSMAKKTRSGSASKRPAGAPYAGRSGPAASVALPGKRASPGKAPSRSPLPPTGVSPPGQLPAEIESGDVTVALLALMIFLAPAIGSPYEELLQDTLKSMVVSLTAVSAGLLFFWRQRQRALALRWHAVMWLPLALTGYAALSMAWSHTYLAAVEAIRWFVFSLLLWLGLNTLSRRRLPWVFEAIHWGAVVASVWAALQFWFDSTLWPQGPNPGSTFVNRNFFAEFVVCTLPFSFWLLAQARRSPRIAMLALTLGFNVVALMMTGTRGALSAFWLLLLLVLPAIAVHYRRQFAFSGWSAGRRLLAGSVFLASVVGLGSIGSDNPKILADSGASHLTAFDRALHRTASISPNDFSLGVRVVMWQATARMISSHPLAGVGAGAWEAKLPLYQTEGAQLETDYYAHNEFLQVLAEYGLVGWLFVLGLLSYLAHALWAMLRNRSAEALAEAPERMAALASLLALLIVSNIGFPWRLASTGALFALSLALLAASDARLQAARATGPSRLPWRPIYSQALAALLALCLALTLYISQQAAAAESKIVSAVKMALSISQSGDYANPEWRQTKQTLMLLVQEGVAINPHYRKITPMVADEMAKWGDWADAVWVWESVARSRPYVVGILLNIARGYAQLNDYDKALEYLARAERIQPRAAGVRSLKVIIDTRIGREAEALALSRQYLGEGTYDADLLNAAYVLALRAGDIDMAVTSLQLRLQSFPALTSDSLMKLGDLYAGPKNEPDKALAAYRGALASATPAEQAALLSKVPQRYRSQL